MLHLPLDGVFTANPQKVKGELLAVIHEMFTAGHSLTPALSHRMGEGEGSQTYRRSMKRLMRSMASLMLSMLVA